MHGMKTALPHHRLVGGLGVGQRALEEEEGEEEEVVGGALEAPKGLVSRATMGKEGEVASVVVGGGEEEEEDLDGEDLVSHCQCVARLTSS